MIMDGNGRWAKARGLPRTAGHRAGMDKVKEIVKACGEMDIKVLTLFAFSTENWSRPKKEIDTLMRYFIDSLKRQVDELHKNNVRFRVIGRKEPLPEYLLTKIREAEEKTSGNSGLTLVLALNYGSRQEIVDGVKQFARDVLQRNAALDGMDEEKFGAYLYTAGLPDPDLLIRTSGEMRISNFLLWQASYAELYFSDKCWPDFKKQDLQDAIQEYQHRHRRFGKVKHEKR